MWICNTFCVCFCWFRLKSIPKLNTVAFLRKDLVSDKFQFFSRSLVRLGNIQFMRNISQAPYRKYTSHTNTVDSAINYRKGNAFSAIKMLTVTIQRTSGSQAIDDENSPKDKILYYHQFQYQILWTTRIKQRCDARRENERNNRNAQKMEIFIGPNTNVFLNWFFSLALQRESGREPNIMRRI